MAINVQKQPNSTTTYGLLAAPQYLARNRITVNQPVQTHFSVEGVQAYSPEEIKAMKIREDKLSKVDGEYVKVKNYETVDLDKQDENIDGAVRVRPLTQKKERAKADLNEFKTNVRNTSSLANQNLVKIEKQVIKKSTLEKKLQKLVKTYKKHFQGVDMKQGQRGSIPEECEQAGEIDLDEGDQCIPVPQAKSQKSTNAQNVTSLDDSFEEVPWVEEGVNIIANMMDTSGSYSEKLGNAVHLLFN